MVSFGFGAWFRVSVTSIELGSISILGCYMCWKEDHKRDEDPLESSGVVGKDMPEAHHILIIVCII